MDYTEKHNEQRIISLCTGSRGLEKGVQKVLPGLRAVAYVEIEAFILFNLVAEMEAGLVDTAPVWSNLKTFDAKPFHNKIHGITAGYPCQPFSNAGNRQGTEDPRHLWPYIREVIRTVRPIWAFFENVEGHLTMGYKEVHYSLRNMGYKVEAGLYSAAEMGAPHQRKRLFILACSDVDELRRCLADTMCKHGGLSKESGKWENKVATSESSENVEYANVAKIKNFQNGNEAKFTNIRSSGDLLADTSSIRSRKGLGGGASKQFNENGSQWPARPGEPQFEWEEKRTTKSGMGCSANGYNFRTELLRMYGNGVVEQVAQKAFYELLVNQIKNFNK